jgi:WD40 repeat protein
LPEDFFGGGPEFLQVTFCPVGNTLAVTGEFHCNSAHGGLVLWDLQSDCKKFVVQKDLVLIYSFAYSPDGKLFATGHREGAVKLWDAASCKKVADLGRHDGRALTIAFSPDGTLLATGGVDHEVFIWDVAKREKRSTILVHSRPVNCLAFSPNGKSLATTSVDGRLCLTDVETGKLIGGIGDAGKDSFCAVAFSPDGKSFASIGPHLTKVYLWETATCKQLAVFEGHENGANCIAFSPDGKLLATSGSGVVKLWDIKTKKERFTLDVGTAGAISFSPDGRILAVSNGRDGVRLWEVATGKPYEPDPK